MLQLDDFAEKVAMSGLVPTAELTQARAQVEPEPAADASLRLARLLVQQGLLTTYQARKLLAGATSGFFLGGYRILRPLGEGGMGKVFLAVNEQTFGKVAIKVLPPRKALEEAGSLVRFRREMELSQRCDHPNLARTLAVGNEGDVHFMVMEYIPGKSLFDMVKSERYGPLRVPDAARLFLKLLDGLDAAHQAGLVHRDIKPSNIMITPDGDAKLLDLGLARAMGDEKGITRANTVLGTLDYASPEQLSDAAKCRCPQRPLQRRLHPLFHPFRPAPFRGGRYDQQDLPAADGRPRTAREHRPGRARGLRRHGPQADDQEARRALSDLQGAARRPGALDRPHPAAPILGAEAEAARSFHPPPPPLADEDLRLLSIADDTSPSVLSLRDLGDAEPSPAPRHRWPLPPLPAAVRHRPEPDTRTSRMSNDTRWLLHFSLIVLGLGLIAILTIALLLRG